MAEEVSTILMPTDDDIAAETELPATPPMLLDEGLKITKKRERELSLEPSTSKELPPSTSAESKEPRVPAKKNRLEPIILVDDDEPLPSTPPQSRREIATPPPLQSPQHETKVTQIRKRVEDMSWQDQVDRGGPSIRISNDIAQGSNDNNLDTSPPTHDDQERDCTMNGSQDEPSYTRTDDVSGNRHENHDSDSNEDDKEAKAVMDRGDDETDRSLKRKLQDRSSSYNMVSDHQTRQDSSKRPRDDVDSDPNPRGIKRAPTPPAKTAQISNGPPNEPLQTAPPVSSGFLAFASSSSPFATVKPGPNSWTSPNVSFLTANKPASAGDSSNSLISKGSIIVEQKDANYVNDVESNMSSHSDSKPKPIFGVTSAPGQGFTGFANLSSPFSSTFVTQQSAPSTSTSHAGPNRSKSPTRHGSAFTPYNSAVRGFATPKSPRRKRSNSPTGSSGSAERTGPEEGTASLPESENEERPTSFADRLKEDRGTQPDGHEVTKVDLQEQELITGEEDEKTVFSVRAKLYILSDQKQWKERGIGPLKLNVRKTDGGAPRLVMRKEGVHSLVLNVLLFTGMKFEIAQDPRYVRFGVPNELKNFDHYNIRLSSAKAAEELVEAVNMSTS